MTMTMMMMTTMTDEDDDNDDNDNDEDDDDDNDDEVDMKMMMMISFNFNLHTSATTNRSTILTADISLNHPPELACKPIKAIFVITATILIASNAIYKKETKHITT